MVTRPEDSRLPSARKKRRVGLSAYQEQRLKEQLRPSICSEPWLEAQFKSADDTDETGTPILYRYHDPHVFPPGGAKTAMARCPECGVLVPPNTLEHGACLDHARHDGWGPSPSAVAIRALQMFNLRIEDSELAPEDLPSLRKEIEDYHQQLANPQNTIQSCK
jgi:hypothetical protein